ncbi:hypothetical protein GBAR_LOCUS6084 [Geodia barretti]|uniref:Uncharacterized protein n=1 Tax=Geodia barretti TaxID=519541 RepID=A0AA35RF25_GEOBA|nr:hypothetical protein GBAR_LOCUS6084 [Geodia barretti]
MEEEIEESLVLEAGGGDTSVGETSWLHGKSQMLDEVNQLVELMTAEKSKLQEKIIALESEVDGCHKQTEQLRLSSERKEEHVSRLQLEQSALKEKSSQ